MGHADEITRAKLAAAIQYIEKLAAMPDSAILYYKHFGNTVTHEIGKSARIILQKLNPENQPQEYEQGKDKLQDVDHGFLR